MEDLLDNIIYFILLAVFMIVPALTRKKKQAVQNLPPPDASQEDEENTAYRKPISLLDTHKAPRDRRPHHLGNDREENRGTPDARY